MSSSLGEMIEVANTQQPHCAVALILDTSGSMAGGNIDQLNEALRHFREDVEADDLARKRIEVAIVTFGGTVAVAQPFAPIESFAPPTLDAGGGTPMGEAIVTALDLLDRRKAEYRAKGVDYYRPWVFLVTDGEPTDMSPGDDTWASVTAAIRDGEQKGKFLFFAVGAAPANLEMLGKIAAPTRPPLRVRPGMFKEMFQWLSKSLSRVSASKVGDRTPLAPVNPWSDVATG